MRRRRPASRRARAVISIIMVTGLTTYGAVLLGAGVSDFIHEHALATSGVLASAKVTATSGYGDDMIQVSYQVSGHQVLGTVGANPSSAYQGETVPVVYDPGNPQVVSLVGDVGDTSSAWVDTVVGGFFLLLFPVALLLGLISRRRSRRRQIRAALGD